MGKASIAVLLMASLACALFVPSKCFSQSLMVEKNLFAPDRKPPTSDAAVAGKKQANIPPGSIQLDAVFGFAGANIALLRLKTPPAPAHKGEVSSPFIKVREGEPVGEYRVTKIESRKVTLEKDGEPYEVNLFQKDKVSTPVSAPPPIASSPSTPQSTPAQPPQPAGAHPPVPPKPGQPQQAPGQVPAPPTTPAGPVPAQPGPDHGQEAPAAVPMPAPMEQQGVPSPAGQNIPGMEIQQVPQPDQQMPPPGEAPVPLPPAMQK